MSSEGLRRLMFAAALAGLPTLAAACADLSRGPAPADMDAAGGAGGDAGDAGSDSSDGAVSFATQVHGTLTGSCMRCHAAGGEAGDTSFLLTGVATADLASTTRFIDLQTPAASRLLAKMSGKGHGGGTVFAVESTEYQTVLRWIRGGARP